MFIPIQQRSSYLTGLLPDVPDSSHFICWYLSLCFSICLLSTLAFGVWSRDWQGDSLCLWGGQCIIVLQWYFTHPLPGCFFPLLWNCGPATQTPKSWATSSFPRSGLASACSARQVVVTTPNLCSSHSPWERASALCLLVPLLGECSQSGWGRSSHINALQWWWSGGSWTGIFVSFTLL